MVERVTLIIEAFDEPDTPLPLEEIARRTQLPRSTAYRIVLQLIESSWLQHTKAGYRLGSRPLRLAGRAGSHQALRTAAAPNMYQLSHNLAAVVHLGILAGGDVLYLDKTGGGLIYEMTPHVGAFEDSCGSVMGIAMLSTEVPEEMEKRIPTASLNPLDRRRLYQRLNQVRQRHGMAIGNAGVDFTVIAAPIPSRRGPVGALSISLDPERSSKAACQALRIAAQRTAMQLGVDQTAEPCAGQGSFPRPEPGEAPRRELVSRHA